MLSIWLYTSTCTFDRAHAQGLIGEIAEASRARNPSLEVTGALIWTGCRFAQFIEGPAAAIDELRRVISADRRHHDIRTFETPSSMTRLFAGWSLAYSGAAPFIERELARICSGADIQPGESARDLKTLLVELNRSL